MNRSLYDVSLLSLLFSLLLPSLTHIKILSGHCWVPLPSSPVILKSPRRLERGRVLVQLEWRNLQQRLSTGEISCRQTHIYGSSRSRFLLLLAICRSSACLIFPNMRRILTCSVVGIQRNWAKSDLYHAEAEVCEAEVCGLDTKLYSCFHFWKFEILGFASFYWCRCGSSCRTVGD